MKDIWNDYVNSKIDLECRNLNYQMSILKLLSWFRINMYSVPSAILRFIEGVIRAF